MSTPCGVALIHLGNEVAGIIGAYEPGLRELIGNTNLAVLKLRLEEAQRAIALLVEPQDFLEQNARLKCPACVLRPSILTGGVEVWTCSVDPFSYAVYCPEQIAWIMEEFL